MADLALLVLTLLWGTTFHFVKGVLAVASPGLFLVARFATATATLTVVRLFRRDAPSPGLWRHGTILGALVLAGLVLQTVGLRFTTPARSAFLTGLSVLVVPFVARFAYGRAVRGAAWAGVTLAVAGLALLTRPLGEGLSAEVRLGDALTAACALAFALQIVLTSEWSPRHPLVPFVLAQVAAGLAGTILLLPLDPLRLEAAGLPTLAATALFTGVPMTAGAFFVMAWAQRRTTAVRAALIFSLEPVSAALFSHWYGGEALAAADWAGGALVVLGVVVGEVGSALPLTRRTA
jgi:drug/metabolite transporter (DMT)-like permease